MNELGKRPILLSSQNDALVHGVFFSQNDEIADIEGEDAAPLCRGPQQLRLITGIERDPRCWRAGYIVPAGQQRPLQGLAGSISIKVQLRRGHDRLPIFAPLPFVRPVPPDDLGRKPARPALVPESDRNPGRFPAQTSPTAGQQ